MNGGASASEVDVTKTSESPQGATRRTVLARRLTSTATPTVILDGHDQGLAAGQFAVFTTGAWCPGKVILEQPARSDLRRLRTRRNWEVPGRELVVLHSPRATLQCDFSSQ